MTRAQRDSLRWLKAVLIAAIVLPLAIFLYVAWLDYQNIQSVADRQIERTADVLTEHALKVFEAVDRTIAEIDAIIGDDPDSEVTARQEELHNRLKKLADDSSEIKSVWIFGRDGRAIGNSITYPVTAESFADRDYFKAHIDKDVGTFIGAVLTPRPPYGGSPFFGVSRRRSGPDGTFNGVIQVSVLPEYFSNFYEKLAKEPGAYASIVRADGLLLARFPPLGREAHLVEDGPIMTAMRKRPESGALSLVSALDGAGRKIEYRKIGGFPGYVIAGLETSAIRQQWYTLLISQFSFGMPASAALIGIILLAFRRTERLYTEAIGRQAAEAALRQTRRMESLGQLTGGVAHDFNNLLAIVGGGVAKLKRPLNEEERLRAVAMMDTALQRGQALTQKLLAFSRRDPPSQNEIELNGCIENFLDVLKQAVGSGISLRFKRSPAPLKVVTDPRELELVLLNLTVNARDAMPHGGSIVVSLAAGTPVPLPEGARAGSFALIEVADTGAGIAEEIRERIFEPYFSTKGPDKGTGLGLSQVYAFVQQSGGSLSVESEIGKGTTFQIFLPIARAHG